MSNEIKNTLFRFVSMRAPELSTDLESKPGFITDEGQLNGIFNDAIREAGPNGSKKIALQNAAADFANSALDVEAIKNLNKNLYEFSKWLAKNRFKANDQEIKDKITTSLSNVELNLNVVWNNLIYQIVTQKDFYAKEILMQLLLAYHVIKVTKKGNHKERALAKVVLPKDFFYENQTATNASRESLRDEAKEIAFSNSLFQKLENQIIAEKNREVLTTLKLELANAEKAYQMEYQVAYNNEYKDYQVRIKPILDQYNLDLENATKSWCDVRPNLEYNPNDLCQQPPSIPEPVLPEFEFEFEKEMDVNYISKFLCKQSLEIYQNLLNPENIDNNDDSTSYRLLNTNQTNFNFSTFTGASNTLDELIEVNNNSSSQNTINNGSTSVVIGGTNVVIPNTITPLLPFNYEIKSGSASSFITSLNTMKLMVGIPDTSWQINAIQYVITKQDDTTLTRNSSNVSHYTGYDIMLALQLPTNEINLKELSITFQFANGNTASISIQNFNVGTIYKGIIPVRLEFDDNEENDNNSSIAPEQNFIPSGFGYKQIGIADYNKVEQSIQGYIEGEVAHIENIMAREFKEKSTRRLRRTEITETTSSETESEKLTDTSSVDRFEMQSEVAKVIANSKDFAAQAGISGEAWKIKFSANANYATHNSKEESTRQAMTNAKEITERALDRVVSKIKEERIEKILEEFEENNTHGFDNRKGDNHVVGVYRWVDKVYKNQIVNYGKRLMFEFAIPEPAKLHNLGMQTLVDENNVKVIPVPQDPRTSINQNLEDFSKLDDAKLKYWTGIYNVEFKTKPKNNFRVSKGFNGTHDTTGWFTSGNGELEIPEGYEVNSANASVTFDLHPNGMEGSGVSVNIGNKYFNRQWERHFNQGNINFIDLGGIQQKLAVSYKAFDCGTFSMTVTALCQLTIEAENQWKQETFNAIIKAYEEALTKYNDTLATEATNGVQILGTNPGFYREIENIILRKNCISYLISSNPNDKKTFGKNFYKTNNGSTTPDFGNTIIDQTKELDEYASFVKFMEQAFEWDIMSYYFYPYYWGNRNNWVKMYQFDQTHDPIFKAFMQSGMARVIVTVRPGFEEAVRYYMQTGQIWNGGEVPVIGDELYLSIVEEMRETTGEKVGKAWPTRVPTSLTILQAESIGLKVVKALPYNEDLSDFENEDEVPQSSQIDFNDAQIGGVNAKGTARLIGKIAGNNGINAKIVLRTIAGVTQDITYCDNNGTWELNHLPEGKFELFLDANLDFPIDTYQVVEGAKQLVVELVNNETVEVNIVYEPM